MIYSVCSVDSPTYRSVPIGMLMFLRTGGLTIWSLEVDNEIIHTINVYLIIMIYSNDSLNYRSVPIGMLMFLRTGGLAIWSQNSDNGIYISYDTY